MKNPAMAVTIRGTVPNLNDRNEKWHHINLENRFEWLLEKKKAAKEDQEFLPSFGAIVEKPSSPELGQIVRRSRVAACLKKLLPAGPWGLLAARRME
jgi:hypothetical protein